MSLQIVGRLVCGPPLLTWNLDAATLSDFPRLPLLALLRNFETAEVDEVYELIDLCASVVKVIKKASRWV
jgi:hypothetical protein